MQHYDKGRAVLWTVSQNWEQKKAFFLVFVADKKEKEPEVTQLFKYSLHPPVRLGSRSDRELTSMTGDGLILFVCCSCCCNQWKAAL